MHYVYLEAMALEHLPVMLGKEENLMEEQLQMLPHKSLR
jgi:hypothetical protein